MNFLIKKSVSSVLCMLAGLFIASGQKLKVSVNSSELVNSPEWSFEENNGQVLNDSVKYFGSQGGAAVLCFQNKVSFVFFKEISGNPAVFKPRAKKLQKRKFSSARMDMVLLNSDPQPVMSAEELQVFSKNYYLSQLENKPEDINISPKLLQDSFAVYPNPFTDELKVIFRLAKSSNVSLAIMNMVGQAITPEFVLNEMQDGIPFLSKTSTWH